jgi:phage terminase small subunit
MLTAKQEKFALNIVNGMSQADAYRDAYPGIKMSDKTVWERASVLAKNNKVKARIEELRAELAKPSIMTAQERLEWLTTVVKDDEQIIDVRLKASDQMSKMQGAYIQRIEADVDTHIDIVVELTE